MSEKSTPNPSEEPKEPILYTEDEAQKMVDEARKLLEDSGEPNRTITVGPDKSGIDRSTKKEGK